MRRTLLVTNDFPPRAGGIQSYVHAFASLMPADDLVVYAPAWDGAAEFDAAQPFQVVRHSGGLMLPVPSVAKRAAELLKEHRLTGVWFGAAAPLGLLASYLRKHGATRVVASTHGHEVGWSMLPGARQALRVIGDTADVVTFVSKYARGRFAAAFGPRAALEPLFAGVDTTTFSPDPVARQRIRQQYGIGADEPVVVCVSRLVARKGQDTLIAAIPAIRAAVPGTRLLIVGGGPDEQRLRGLAQALAAGDAVTITGKVPTDQLAAHYVAGDVFAMPCRTRGGGLDVEGLGIVFLEASACGLPVVAGDSGGAPEAVRPGHTGVVVDGTDVPAVAAAVGRVLGDAETAKRWGAAGRAWVQQDWTWQRGVDRLIGLLA